MNAFLKLLIYEGMEFCITVGHTFSGTSGGAFGWHTALQAGGLRVRFIGIFD